MTAFGEGVVAGYGIAIPVGAIAILIIELGLRRGFRAGFMDVRVTPKDDTLNNLAASVPVGMPFSALITARKP